MAKPEKCAIQRAGKSSEIGGDLNPGVGPTRAKADGVGRPSQAVSQVVIFASMARVAFADALPILFDTVRLLTFQPPGRDRSTRPFD